MKNIPTRQETAEKIKSLINGSHTREEVSLWASKYVLDDTVDIPDEAVKGALFTLVGADVFADRENYLYHVIDFNAWLKELRIQP